MIRRENMQTVPNGRTIVISGGTDGMGKALGLARAERGDQVIAIGSTTAKGKALMAEAAARGVSVRFLLADLATIAGTRQAIDHILDRHDRVDALVLFANRQAPRRILTTDGLERTFALYYLSRYLLGHGLRAALDRSASPVIVNVAGVGSTKGSVHWDDLRLDNGYSMINAQLQAGRANDLLGVAFAQSSGSRARYVLYHPGFTRSGDLSPLPTALRAAIQATAAASARPVAASIEPIHGFIDNPPAAPLTAIDRDKILPLTYETLDPGDATRLSTATGQLLARHD
jgi:NAD(P)-dependent dehydrogenase (short-subunit alcohol dehydrogenase family)